MKTDIVYELWDPEAAGCGLAVRRLEAFAVTVYEEGRGQTAWLSLDQAAEMHRKLGDALTDERVRRAELDRSKTP